LQLIEIVQLVLVGFISISLIIFFISYIGYRRRVKQNYSNTKPPVKPQIQKVTKQTLEQEKNPAKTILSAEQNPVSKSEVINSIQTKNKQSKFEVFRPSREKEHYPKILIVKSPEDKGSKIN